MRIVLTIAIIVAFASAIVVHYTKARTDTQSEILSRNAESRLRSIIGALETGCRNVEWGKTNTSMDAVIVSLDRDLRGQGIGLFKMPIVKTDIRVCINPNANSWREPSIKTNEIAVYWDFPFRTNNATKEYLGMTFDRKAIWFADFPTWAPVPLENILPAQ